MRVYLLHNERQAEQILAPIVTRLDGTLWTGAGVREIVDEALSRRGEHCLVTSVLPGKESAIEFMPELRRQLPDLPVIVWSSHLDVSTGVELMRLGAFTVLEFACSPSTLLLTLHQALQESEQLSERVVRESDLRGKLGSLTDGELEVMRMLLDGLTNKEIASKLAVSRRTIEARRQRIVKVTGVSNLIRLVVVMAEHGLLENPRPFAPQHSGPVFNPGQSTAPSNPRGI